MPAWHARCKLLKLLAAGGLPGQYSCTDTPAPPTPQEEVEGGLYGDGGAAEEPPAEPAGTASTGGGALSGSAGPASPRIALPPGMQFPGRKQLFPIIPPSERCGQCKACLNPKLKRACIEARKRQLEAGLAVRLPSAQYSSPSTPRAGALASGGGGVGGKRATAVATAAAVAAGQALGPALCGCRVRVYWAGMSRWQVAWEIWAWCPPAFGCTPLHTAPCLVPPSHSVLLLAGTRAVSPATHPKTGGCSLQAAGCHTLILVAVCQPHVSTSTAAAAAQASNL